MLNNLKFLFTITQTNIWHKMFCGRVMTIANDTNKSYAMVEKKPTPSKQNQDFCERVHV